jgi:Mg/Co/Ni transporter MgtE
MIPEMHKADKQKAMSKLRAMELDQIADWLNRLPEERWERLFLVGWPVLAKKCGVEEEAFLHTR